MALNLRWKVALCLVGAAIGLAALLGLGFRSAILAQYQRTEDDLFAKDALRVRAAFQGVIDRLSQTAGDWGAWSQTYDYMVDLNEQYVEANVRPEALVTLGANLMVWVDTNGAVVRTNCVDLNTQKPAYDPKDTISQIVARPSLVRHSELDSQAWGVVQSGSQLMLVVSHPIIRDDRTGPAQGALIVGRWIDRSALQSIQELAGVELSLITPQSLKGDKLGAKAISQLDSRSIAATFKLNRSQATTYAMIRDQAHEPALIARIEQSRSIYQQGEASVNFMMWWTIGAGALFVLLGYVLVEGMVLTRIRGLMKEIGGIRGGTRSGARVEERSNDEVTELAKSINHMLLHIEMTHEARLEEQRKFHGAMQASMDAFCMVEVRGSSSSEEAELVVSDINQVGARLLDSTRKDVIGRPMAELWPFGTATNFLNHVLDVHATGIPYEAELLCHDSESRPTWLHHQVVRIGTGLAITTRDMTARRSVEEALRLSEERLELAVQSAHEGLWDINHVANTVYFSSAYRKLLGYDETEWEDSVEALHRLIHPVDLIAFQEAVEACYRSRLPFVVEHRMRHKDGSYRWFRSRGATTFDEAGRPTRFSGFTADITDEKETQDALRRANEELAETLNSARHLADQAEAASQAKSEFLANMSHEIRTPMNGVMGMTEVLLQSDLSPEQRDCATTIHSSADALLTLINDILDFSKIEAGKLRLENTEVEIAAVVHGVANLLRQKAVEKGIELTVLVDSRVPQTVITDPLRVRQILINLVGNAIKFTERGSVDIELKLLRTRQATSWFELSVADTGVGIDQAHLEAVFDVFTQADSSPTRRFGGTGLGLAITKQLATLLGGTVSVESVRGKGSRFWVEFPVQIAFSAGSAEPDEVQLPTDEPLGIKVLVAEDNAVNQRVASQTLHRLGCEVEIASNGADALMKATSGRYDVILMDCQMPVMDGFEATRAIRDHEKVTGEHVIIVAMTANAMQGDRDLCIEAGMDDYISKPFRIDDLHRVLHGWTKKRVEGNVIPRFNADEAIDTLNVSYLLDASNDDRGFVIEVLSMFESTCRDQLEQLREAWETSRWEDAGKLLHALKGSSASSGAMRFSDLCLKAEHVGEGIAHLWKDVLFELQTCFSTTILAIEDYRLNSAA